METTIRKIGNSVGAIIPSELNAEAGDNYKIANCKCKLASAGEDSWRKGFSEFQLKKAKQYEPCEHA